jgi:hypothetical protein
MPSLSQMSERDQNALPPLPPDHGFCEGDHVELPVYGRGRIRGVVKYIDIVFRKRLYKGLAILGDDGAYYELEPSVTQKVDAPDKKKPPTR